MGNGLRIKLVRGAANCLRRLGLGRSNCPVAFTHLKIGKTDGGENIAAKLVGMADSEASVDGSEQLVLHHQHTDPKGADVIHAGKVQHNLVTPGADRGLYVLAEVFCPSGVDAPSEAQL